jgi:hypothetical protein
MMPVFIPAFPGFLMAVPDNLLFLKNNFIGTNH